MILQELITKLGFETDERPLHKLEHTLESMHHKLEFLAAVEIVKGIWELAERFAGMGEQLETAAVQAGITAEEFQRLAFAASQNAVGQDELSGALAKMSRTLQKAKDGSEGAVGIFRKLGIGPEQIATFNNAEDAFFAVQGAIAGVDSSTKRLAMTQEVFGRGSSKLVKLLGKGTGETKRLMGEADRIGAVVSNAGVENLANFEDAFSGMMEVFRKFAAGVGAMFAPMLTRVIHQVEDFWAANQALIKQDIRKWAGTAAYAFGFLVGIVEFLVKTFAGFIKQHPELVENLGKVMLAFMALSLATGATKLLLGGVVDSFKAIAGAASLAKPVMLGVMWLGRGVAVLLVRAMAALVYTMGVVLYDMFPMLGARLMALGESLLALSMNPFFLQLAGYAALVAAIVIAVHDLWAVLHGGKFEDTWTYKLFQGAKNMAGGAFKWLAKKFGFGEEEGLEGPPRPLNAFEGLPMGIPLMPSVGTGALQALAATGQPLAGADGVPPMLARPQENTWNVTINAPTTFNGTLGTKQDMEAAAAATRQALEQAISESHRNLTGAAHS